VQRHAYTHRADRAPRLGVQGALRRQRGAKRWQCGPKRGEKGIPTVRKTTPA